MPQDFPHPIDYIEFTVRDLVAAKHFYAKALGWSFIDYGPEYSGIVREGGESGGLCVGEPRPGGPLVVLHSSDLQKSYEQVRQAGAKITAEIFSFPGGSRFQFLDLDGNELGVWAKNS